MIRKILFLVTLFIFNCKSGSEVHRSLPFDTLGEILSKDHPKCRQVAYDFTIHGEQDGTAVFYNGQFRQTWDDAGKRAKTEIRILDNVFFSPLVDIEVTADKITRNDHLREIIDSYDLDKNRSDMLLDSDIPIDFLIDIISGYIPGQWDENIKYVQKDNFFLYKNNLFSMELFPVDNHIVKVRYFSFSNQSETVVEIVADHSGLTRRFPGKLIVKESRGRYVFQITLKKVKLVLWKS